MAKKTTKMTDLEKSIYNKAAAINARLKSIGSRKLDSIQNAWVQNSEFMTMVKNQMSTNTDVVSKSGKTFKRSFKKNKYTTKELQDIEQLYSDILLNDSPIKSLNREVLKITNQNTMEDYNKMMKISGWEKTQVNKIVNTMLNPNQNYDDYDPEVAKEIGRTYRATGDKAMGRQLVSYGFDSKKIWAERKKLNASKNKGINKGV